MLGKKPKRPWQDRLFKKLLRTGTAYRLAEAYLARQKGRFPLEATRLLTLLGLEQARRAYQNERSVIWTSAFVPVEIIYALDLLPFSPEVGAAVVTALGFAPETLRVAEENWVAPEACSFHRCAYGAALRGYFPSPQALVASSHLCDGAPKLFRNLSAFYQKEFFLLDVPFTRDQAAVVYVAEQLKDLVSFLEVCTGHRLDPARLREVIQNSNQARAALVAANAVRTAVPAPLQGEHALNYLYLFFTGHGNPEAVNIYQTLAAELKDRGAKQKENLSQERYRLLWLHIRPYFQTELWEHIARLGAVIAFEEFTHVYWEELNPEEPFLSLARKMLAHFLLGPVERRVAVIKKLARDYQVDGVVHFSHWGCRQSCGGVKILKDALQAEGFPFLVLEGDCVDNRNWSPGQVQTRLEGFLELLAGRKRECL